MIIKKDGLYKRQKPYHCRFNYSDMAFYEKVPHDLFGIATNQFKTFALNSFDSRFTISINILCCNFQYALTCYQNV